MTSLPLVHIQGPPNPGASSQPFWEILAVAPEFGLDNVEPEKEGVQEDRVHPIRTLLLDPGETELKGRRLPRLLSMHVVAGQRAFHQKDERLILRFSKDGEINLPHAQPQFDIPFYASGAPRTGVHHVVVEPILATSQEWPDLAEKAIDVPKLRLVAGTIGILVNRTHFKNLGPLGFTAKEELEGRKAILLRLTPEGIEIDAEVEFPGQAGKLFGHFVLLPAAKSPRLRLLPDRLEEPFRGRWREAWGAVTPAGQAISGLQVDARLDGPPPAFTWSTKLTGKKISSLLPEVEVPAEALTVRLLSPGGPNGPDGEVTLKPEAYKLAAFDASLAPDPIESVVTTWDPKPKVMLSAEMTPAAAPKFETQLVLDANKDIVTVRLAPIGSAKGHVCAHDERALASALRASYGLEELAPGRLDDKRPLLAAFMPLDDGWLQLPVPNFPPLDLSTDVDRVPFVQPPPNVLSGYLRYAQTGTLPPVLSAFQAEPGLAVKEAPWVITVEGAQRLAMVIGIDTDGKKAALVRFAAALDNPELSTRGLVWISADRPDELEALPRLGAGAGAYFDLPLETFDIEEKPAVQLTITELELKVAKTVLTREKLALTYTFDAEQPDWKELATEGKDAIAATQKVLGGSMNPLPPVLWRRHPRMPFAAAMPMTRGAGSSVRPLESRDLVPFTADVAAGKSLSMEWLEDAAFPNVTSLRLKPVQKWPWPKKGKEEPHPQGIALAAFGVPGAEVALGDDQSFADDPWTGLRCALRYDLPALDEAFATAALPPVPPEEALPEEREAPPPVPVPLAYDWPAMQGFWDDQNRRHQLARVAHSYLAPYREPGVKQVAVRHLVGGLKWETRLGFEIAAAAEPLPYGKATIDQTATGNDALLGVSEGFHKEGADKLVKGGDEIQVVGFSPSSYKEDGFVMDSRRTGLKPMERVGDRLLLRPVRIAVPGGNDSSAGVNGLATLLRPVAVDSLFFFWFKDLPLAGEKLVPLPDTTGFDAWQDGRLPLSGFEWRLISARDEPEIFERGRDRIPFFGFAFEPLRLHSCTVRGGFVQDATILARLHLGPLRAGAPPDGNLVTLGLTRKDDALTITSLQDKAGLRFVLEEVEGLESRAVVSTGCSWDKGLKLKEGSVALEMFGEERTFNGAKLQAEAAGVTISWSPKKPVATLLPGKGAVAVDGITLHVTAPKGKVTGTLARRILLAPRAELESTQEVPPPITVTLKNAGVEKVSLLGLELPKDNAAFKERTGAFTLTLEAEVDGSILPGFPLKGTLAAGLMARTSPGVDDGRIDLPAGYLDGEIGVRQAADAPVTLERVAFGADCRRRPARRGDPARTDWRGALRFQGRLSIDNAIGWPAIDKGGEVDPNIPWPGVDPNGRTKVKILAKTACKHRVDYVLDGHALPFDLAARVLVPGSNALWTVPAVSTHTLTLPDGTKEASFTAVETIAIGAAEAIVPKPVAPDDKSDLVAFAPRFMEVVEKGKPKDREPGMVNAGAGRAGTVLRGALGMPFRFAFWQANPKGLFLAGGFAGLLAERDGFPAPLLRLPVLAPLVKQDLGTPGLIAQHGATDQAVDVAWADGRAARNVVATLRGAVMPASASDTALRSALLAGSRPAAIPGLTPEETVAAVLVEQSFVVKWNETFPVPDLKTQPFFLAAAVSVARALKQLESAAAPLVLSLVAGYGVEEKKSRSLAAAVLTRSLPPEEENESLRRRLRSELATLGDEVVVTPWTGPAVADLGEVVPVGLVAGPAFADHPQPRAVVLRTVNGEGTLRYDSPPLPRPRERARFTPPLSDANRAYADAGRGFGLKPDDGTDPIRWLAGPEEGLMQPFRDGTGDKASGLSGMSRVMALPAHAADVTAGAMARRLVWVAQTRAPIYLDLPLKEVKTPPVPWLTPATPRARLPVDEVVSEVLGPQAILPDAATVASIGDRAGISLARIARCETSVSEFSAFDDRHARFGRPAQGGAWSVRTERTPRPGPLPENRGDLERDRRPCATPLLATVPLHALVGPADTVSGEPSQNIGRWSVTFVAAPEWKGLVTEKWDGTIPLLAEVDVEDPEKKLTDPASTLFGLLFPKVFPARASLVIGKVVVPLLRLHFQKAGTFQDLAGGIRRGVVALVLDARPGDTSLNSGPALGSIAEALAVAPLPAVEVRLLVHPDSRAAVQPERVTDLKADEASLAEGEGRAPVMLRFPLSPVVRSRGALPLVPASVLFMDPAYNAGLSSAPAEDRKRVTAPSAALKPGRGALFAVLYADRARVNRKASITFMLDLAFEKKLDLRARLIANGKGADGDIVKSEGTFLLRLEVIPKDGSRRDLFIGKPAPVPVPGFKPPTQPEVWLAHVYELPLSNVVETDGTAAAFVAGDMLVLEIAEKEAGTVTAEVLGDQPDLGDKVKIDKLHDTAISRTLRIILTDEPVVEPPSALYAALVRRTDQDEKAALVPGRLSLPLYAQSPLPWRVDLRDAKADFRRGLMRRSATFVWTLARPAAEQQRTGIHVVKVDRNGQTFLPPASTATPEEMSKLFMKPRIPGDPKLS